MTEIDIVIKKGHWMITYPMTFLTLLSFGVSIYLANSIEIEIETWVHGTLSVIVILSSMLFIPLIYRSLIIIKWKNWAFRKVRNVHELKKRAIQEGILFDDKNPLRKFEFSRNQEKNKWKDLQEKFKTDDIFIDDSDIPNQTYINHPKTNIIAVLVILFFLIIGIWMLIESEIFGVWLISIGLYITYIHFKDTVYFNNKPQILINNEGIKTINTKFFNWNQVQNEVVVADGNGNNERSYLKYEHPEGNERFEITKLDTNQIKLEKLINIYKGRSKTNTI